MIIAISGTPGTGKTTISKLLAVRLGYEVVPFNEIVDKTKSVVDYDREMDAKVVDVGKLKRSVKKLEGNKIIDGHLSHELPVDLVIVLRCNPRTLETRLINKYPENNRKVAENVHSEILGVITSEAINSNENVHEVDVTGKETEEIVDEVEKIVKSKFKGQKIFVDWAEEYSDWLL